MAKIYNFELKSLKSFQGREGYGCSATLYYNGKKVACYTDAGDGGCPNLYWENNISNEAKEKIFNEVKSFYNVYPKFSYGPLSSEELVMELVLELADLKEMEAQYKKLIKKAPNGVVWLVSFNERTEEMDLKKPDLILTSKGYSENIITEIKTKYDNPKVITAYKSLDDFTIGSL